MLTLTADGENLLLTYLFATAGTELALATDATLTEVDDAAYDRVDLPSVLASPSDGSILNDTAFTFDVGSDVATHWFVIEPASDQAVAYGQLPSPQTGEFTFSVGALRIEAISG